MKDEEFKTYSLLSMLLDECADELEVLVVEEVGETSLVQRIRDRIDNLFGPKESRISEIRLDKFVKERIEALRPLFSHREINIIPHLKPVPPACVPQEVLQKVFDGLIKNAIENTPDEGRIEIIVLRKGEEGADLLRMKIFSERYNFKINMESSRCLFIPNEGDVCPGRISQCHFCTSRRDCYLSGATAFTVFFPPAPDQGCFLEEDFSS
ncbi:MAG: hypothetical protein ABIG67_03725 [Pseudomonadota bacterium]